MKKVKSVAFQLADPMEFRLYHWAAKNTHFSTYIKRLIQRDMEGGASSESVEWDKAYEEYMKNNEG